MNIAFIQNCVRHITPRLNQIYSWTWNTKLISNLLSYPKFKIPSTLYRQLQKGPFKRLLPFPLTIGVLRANCEKCKFPEGTAQDPSCKASEESPPTATEGTCGTPSSVLQIKWEPTELTHEYLMKQACSVTVDSVTRILTETVSAIEDYHFQYREYLSLLMDLLNESRRSPECAQELLTCKMVVVRSRIEELRKTIVELECYLNSVERLAHATAEVAFLGHAEYSSIALSERLQSTLLEAKHIKEVTTELERDVNELQAVIIVESGNSLK